MKKITLLMATMLALVFCKQSVMAQDSTRKKSSFAYIDGGLNTVIKGFELDTLGIKFAVPDSEAILRAKILTGGRLLRIIVIPEGDTLSVGDTVRMEGFVYVEKGLSGSKRADKYVFPNSCYKEHNLEISDVFTRYFHSLEEDEKK